MKKTLTILAVFCSNLTLAAVQQPKLIVQLVVDQLRGDLLSQYQSKFSPHGFNYLLEHGLNYRNAHHPHAHTVTCAGHATIATGSYPSLHGIISNEWYDRASHHEINCVDDPQSPILITKHSKKSVQGRSPKNLLVSTLSDEIVLAKKGASFAVSLKDRAAITLAGHAGRAFWFDRENGGFVTSRHYYSSYPQWVSEWNDRYHPNDQVWQLSAPQSSYKYVAAPKFMNRFPDFGPSFPHHLGDPNSPSYYKFLSMTPIADELTADFAITLLEKEKLGKSEHNIDYLAISFSSVDAIGHQFGPNSLESEDNLLRLDKTIAKLLSALDKKVGLKNTLIVLTADHGVSDVSTYLTENHFTETKPINIPQTQTLIESALDKRFHLPPKTLEAISFPFIYLNHEIINHHNVPLQEVRGYLAQVLRDLPGVFQAYPIPLSSTEHDWLSAKVDKMAFPGRSGDLYLVPPPYQGLSDDSDFKVNHGTPWTYDSYIPLLFVNPRFTPKQIFTEAHTTDIASTLAAILSIKSPSGSVGQPLIDVIDAVQQE